MKKRISKEEKKNIDFSDLQYYRIVRFNKNVISEMQEEMSFKPIEDREKYYEYLIYKRLEKINNAYLNDLDEKLERTYNNIIEKDDIGLFSTFVKQLLRLNSIFYNKFYAKLLKMISNSD